MVKKLAILGWSLMICALILSGCGPEQTVSADQPTSDPTASTGLANPASVYCEEQGYTLEMRTDEDGGQFGVCIFPDGSSCEEWAFYNGTCSPAHSTEEDLTSETIDSPTEEHIPVLGWYGEIESVPGSEEMQLALLPQEAGVIVVEGATDKTQAQLAELRDSGTRLHIWGDLCTRLDQSEKPRLRVTRLRLEEAGLLFDPDPIEDWEGTLVSTPEMAQVDDLFILSGNFPIRYGITAALDQTGERGLEGQLVRLRDSDTVIHIWGRLICGIPDGYGNQIEVTRIEVDGVPLEPIPTHEVPFMVEGWEGTILSTPPGAQFDDIFQVADKSSTQLGIEATDPTLAQQIIELRDTGSIIHVWGTLLSDVPDVNGAQIQVTRIEVISTPPATSAEGTETVEAWVGTIVSNPPGAQFDDYFQMLDQNGSRYGITSLNPAIEQQLTNLRDTGHLIQVWGTLYKETIDAYGTQIEVARIADYS